MDNKKRFLPSKIHIGVKPSIFLEQKISIVIMVLAACTAAFFIIFGLSIKGVKADPSSPERGFFIPAYFTLDQTKINDLNEKFELIMVGSTASYSGINSDKILIMTGPAAFEANSESFLDEWNEINTHEDWFLHSTPELNSSNRLTNPGYPNLYYMDLNSTGWKNYVISEYLERVTNNPAIDGVFVDEVYDPPTYVSILGSANPTYNASQYESLMSDLILQIKQAIGANKLVILNSDLYKPFTTDMDGGLAEGFVHFAGWSNSVNATKAQWLNDISQISDAEFNGKYILVGSGSEEATLSSMVEYCYASFLIGYNSDSYAYFYWHSVAEGGYQTLYWTNLWAMDVGEPTGNYYEEGGLYKRNFTNGLAVVNPNDNNTLTADLGGTYRRLNFDGTLGDPITQVTLSIKQAAILIPVDTTAPQAVNDLSAS